MSKRFLARLLFKANDHPPQRRDLQDEFYALKDSLLRRYGLKLRDQIQVIDRECWGSYYETPCSVDCYKCDGSGIYSRAYWRLECWFWGGFWFYRPKERVYSPEFCPDIKGHICDGVLPEDSLASRLWLYLLLGKWGLFFRECRSSTPCKPRRRWCRENDIDPDDIPF